MDEQALRTALVERLRRGLEPAMTRLAEQRARQAALTDDEWWEQRCEIWRKAGPDRLECMLPMKDRFLEHRRQSENLPLEIDPGQMAEREADEIMPELLKVRRWSRANGELTDRQYDLARMKASLKKTAAVQRQMKQAAARSTDPGRTRILQALSSNASKDLAALRTLHKPGLDDARLTKVAVEIAGRMQALTEELKSSQKLNPHKVAE